ncbi:hypothetical protein LBMAG53_27190 [Planctomycetota bacterium]|nr:hypothetical protein LBMAG53_27190 [Planctomycetota bacterium]
MHDSDAVVPAEADTDPPLVRRRQAVWRCYRDDRAAAGAALAAKAREEFGDHGELWYAEACCLERVGRFIDADQAFRRANRAGRFPIALPCRVSWRRFQRAVDAAIAALPDPLRDAFAETTLVLADYAEPSLLADAEEPELFGLFEGPVRSERDHGGISPRIHLWRRAHEHGCGSVRELDAEVRQTLWHELGHYLGYDEDELDALGRG